MFVLRFKRNLSMFLLTAVTCYLKKAPDCAVDGAESELWKMVRQEMIKNHNSLLNLVEIWEMPPEQSAITFIVCPVISRVGSNVDHALKGILTRKNIVLLLFHSVAPHVPFTGNSREVLVEPKHKALGDIVDLVMYPTSDGRLLFYDCQQNRDSVNQICHFLFL